MRERRSEVLERSYYVCSCNNHTTPNQDDDLETTAHCNWDESIPVCTLPTYSEQQCPSKHTREARDNNEIDAPEDFVIFKPAPPDVCI